MKFKPFIVLCILSNSLFATDIDHEKEKIFVNDCVHFADLQTRYLLTKATYTSNYPRTINKTGGLVTVNLYDWTSGFFAGNLWYLQELTGDTFWKTKAQKWTNTLEKLKTYTAHHDLGFMMYCSFGNGYRLNPVENKNYKNILVQGASSLSTRFKQVTGCIQSWPTKTSWHNTIWNYPVIMDNMMNLELLVWASKTSGDNRYRDIAISHASTTLKNHIRPDYSSYHVVNYDPETGAVKERATNQGWSDNSTWSRGEAWGIYGFTMMYRETNMPEYLKTAEGMANFFLDHTNLPADKIPYWDFNAEQSGYIAEWPNRTSLFPVSPSIFPISQYRDAAAGAVVSSALFELYEFTKNEKYLTNAITMLHSLSSENYRASIEGNGGFILKKCVGSIPHGSEIDVPLVYADYYYLEALLRYRKYLNKTYSTELSFATCSHVSIVDNKISISGLKTGTSLNVFNMSGIAIYSKLVTNSNTQIDIPEKGVYVLQIGNEKNKITIK